MEVPSINLTENQQLVGIKVTGAVRKVLIHEMGDTPFIQPKMAFFQMVTSLLKRIPEEMSIRDAHGFRYSGKNYFFVLTHSRWLCKLGINVRIHTYHIPASDRATERLTRAMYLMFLNQFQRLGRPNMMSFVTEIQNYYDFREEEFSYELFKMWDHNFRNRSSFDEILKMLNK